VPAEDGSSRIKLIVVSIGFRGRSKIKVTVVSTGGRAFRIGLQFESAVQVEGTEILPKPYEPNSKEFRKVAARVLEGFTGPGLVGGEPKFAAADGLRRPGPFDDLDEEGQRLAQCPDFREHLTVARRRQRLNGRIEDLARKIHTRQASLALQLDRVLGILDLYGVVQGWSLTNEGERLSRIYSESDLLCSLALERGIFDGLDAPSLAAVVSTLTYEGRPNFKAAIDAPTKGTARRIRSLHALWSDLAENESIHRLPVTREPDLGFGVLVYRWAHGLDLARTLDGFTIPPGDFVRNTKQTLDLLRQFGEVAPSESTRRAAKEAVGVLMRGVVAVSSAVDGTGADTEPSLDQQEASDIITIELS
jgi:ATP-dependent RNA helicase HelY